MKKTLFKKTAVLAVVLTLAVSVFAGCAGSPAATEPQPTTQNQVETTAESTSNTQTTGEISLEEAKTIALEYVGISPSDTDIYKAELDDGVYEIEFIYDGFEHEVDVSKTTGGVVRYKKDANYIGNGDSQTAQNEIDLETAKTIAYEYAGVSAENVTMYKEQLDDGDYEIYFSDGTYKYEVDVRKATGEVVKFDKETINNISSSTSAGSISFDEALNIAYNHAGISADAVTKKEIELDHNRYEIEFKADGYEYEYEVSLDGTILKSEKDRDFF